MGTGTPERLAERVERLGLPGQFLSAVALARRLAGILCAMMRDGAVAGVGVAGPVLARGVAVLLARLFVRIGHDGLR